MAAANESIVAHSAGAQLYRETSIGQTLVTSLEELVEDNKISEDLSSKIARQFDRSIVYALEKRAAARGVTFKSSCLHTYQFVEGIWTFVLKNVEFRELDKFLNVEMIKIIAFNQGSSDPNNVIVRNEKKPKRKRRRVDNISDEDF